MPLIGVPSAGETIEVTIRAARSGGRVVREADRAEVRFWAPGREPGEGEPDFTETAEWDDAARGFTAYADTALWAPGTWHYQGRLTAQTGRGPVTGLTEFIPLPLR